MQLAAGNTVTVTCILPLEHCQEPHARV
jgi:hypothetical protein